MSEQNQNEFSLEDALNSQIDALIQQTEQQVDAITFIEHPNYLNQPLHGVEKFIIKVFYGLPLDNEDPYMHIRFFPDDEEGLFMTEVEYASFLIEQKRINIEDPLNIEAVQELLLVCGRRGGKTFIASMISSYETYLLISKGNPQEYYNLPRGQKIRILTVATNGDQARIASDMIKNAVINSPWLRKYVESTTSTSVRIKTKYDLDNELEPSVIVEAMPCTAAGVRGHTVIVAILDELAHFTDNSGGKSGDQVYNALVPSITTFGKDGKILTMSNPYTKSGIFYTLYRKAMGSAHEAPIRDIRGFQMPSWEMNNTLDFDFFRKRYTINPESFDYEYGAEFSTTVTGFFKFPEKIDECIDEDWEEPVRASGNYTYYIAMDPAAVGNGYALCMVHVEEHEDETGNPKKVVHVDRWTRWLVTDEEFATSGTNIIDPAIIDEYIIDLSGKFKISKVRYDQFESASSVNKLVKAGIGAERKAITASYNMEIYKNLRNLIYNDEIILPNYDEGLSELKALQEKKMGKNRFRVSAPISGDTTTDDLADVIAVASFMVTKSEVSEAGARAVGMSISSGRTVRSQGVGKQIAGLQSYRKKLFMHKTRDKSGAFTRKRTW